MSSQPLCMEETCGRTHGVGRPYALCALHRADLAAGVEITLTTGWRMWRGYAGELHGRRPQRDLTTHEGWHQGEDRGFLDAAITRVRGKLETAETNGEALRQQPSPWHHE